MLVALGILTGIYSISGCSIGEPGPVAGWTTYTYEGLKLAVPRSWIVHRQRAFLDHIDGIYAYLAGAKSPGNDRMGVYVTAQPFVDRSSIYRAADDEASRLGACAQADREGVRRPARVTEAAVTGAWGLTVETVCPAGPLSMTVLVSNGTRAFKIRLIQADENAEDAATLRRIAELLTV